MFINSQEVKFNVYLFIYYSEMPVVAHMIKKKLLVNKFFLVVFFLTSGECQGPILAFHLLAVYIT